MVDHSGNVVAVGLLALDGQLKFFQEMGFILTRGKAEQLVFKWDKKLVIVLEQFLIILLGVKDH